MKKQNFISILFLGISLLFVTYSHAQEVIPTCVFPVGGGSDICSEELMQAFLEMSPNKENPTLLIISYGSRTEESVASNITSYTDCFRSRGIENIQALDSTQTIAEALNKINSADIIWFSGGLQRNILKTLEAMPGVIEAIVNRYYSGKSIMGGTSAGASIWSSVMMATSNTIDGVLTPTLDYGFKIFPEAIIDQHFSQRNRLQRLEIAVSRHPYLTGIGIDEDTGILYTNRTSFRVVGPNSVTVLKPNGEGGHEKIILRRGDVYQLPGGTPGADRIMSEDFEGQTNLLDDGNYGDGVFTNPASGITWTFAHARAEGTAGGTSYPINGKGFMLRRLSAASSLQTTFPNGVGTFSFKYRKAHTGNEATRQISVYVNGEERFISPAFGGAGNDKTVHTFSETINEAGPVTIKIAYPTTLPDAAASTVRQITIDDIAWTEYTSSSGVNNPGKSDVLIYAAQGNIVVKNATVGEQIEIYNTLSQRIYQGFVQGETLIPSKPGVAIVKVGNRVQKVVVK
jgi:cyanophycinase